MRPQSIHCGNDGCASTVRRDAELDLASMRPQSINCGNLPERGREKASEILAMLQ